MRHGDKFVTVLLGERYGLVTDPWVMKSDIRDAVLLLVQRSKETIFIAIPLEEDDE